MDILKNIFKHKVNIQDVFGSLEKFSGDIRTLSAVRDTATAFFGESWRFNMEMYIASLPQNYRAKYYSLFRQVLEYEHAVNLWTRATQIVNGSRPITSDILKNLSEYRRYLLRFGVEGQRLFSRLSSMLDVKPQPSSASVSVQQSAPSQSTQPLSQTQREPQPAQSVQSAHSPALDAPKPVEESMLDESQPASVSMVMSNSAPDTKPESDEISDDYAETQSSNTSADSDDENSAYREQLKNKIMQRVREISSSRSDSLNSPVTSSNSVAGVSSSTSDYSSVAGASSSSSELMKNPASSSATKSPVSTSQTHTAPASTISENTTNPNVNGSSDSADWNLDYYPRRTRPILMF